MPARNKKNPRQIASFHFLLHYFSPFALFTDRVPFLFFFVLHLVGGGAPGVKFVTRFPRPLAFFLLL